MRMNHNREWSQRATTKELVDSNPTIIFLKPIGILSFIPSSFLDIVGINSTLVERNNYLTIYYLFTKIL